MEYPYFRKALEDAQLQCQCDLLLTSDERAIASFFVDAIRAGLNEPDTFKFLTTCDLGALPWVVELGVQHVVMDEGLTLEHVDKLAKRIGKTRKNNSGLQRYILELYSGTMVESGKRIS